MHIQNLMNSLWDIRIFLGLAPKESHCIICCTLDIIFFQFPDHAWFWETQTTLSWFMRRLLKFDVIYFTVQNNRQDYRTLSCLTAVLLWIAVLLGVQDGQQLQQKLYVTKNNFLKYLIMQWLKVKVTFILEQVVEAQRGSRGITLLFLYSRS